MPQSLLTVCFDGQICLLTVEQQSQYSYGLTLIIVQTFVVFSKSDVIRRPMILEAR